MSESTIPTFDLEIADATRRKISTSSSTSSSPSSPSTGDSALARLDQVADVIRAEADRGQAVYQQPKLSIVIPAFNERKTILSMIEKVRALNIEKQIIVVDDGSTDGTRELLEAIPESSDLEIFMHEVNQGKGAALQTGFRLAEGEIVIVQDADLEYEPEDILDVIAPILRGESSVAYGSRYLERKHQNSSGIHRFGNWLLTQLSNLVNGQQLTDMETCYKAVRREVLQSFQIEQSRFGFEPEITAKLGRSGHKIVEVPVRYNARSWTEGKKIGVRDLIATIFCIFRYRFLA
jgi:glycosyltransferase involved in cell wall biosynthesis